MIKGTSSIRSVLSWPSISFCRYSLTKGIASKVDDTLSDSKGSFRKTSVRPFCLEKTNMMKADNLISESVICKGMVRPEEAARGCGDVNEGFVDR